MYKIGIVGGTGVLAGYLIKQLVHHPNIELFYIDSEHDPGSFVTDHHKIDHEKIKNKKLDRYSVEVIQKNLDLVFIAKSHGQSMKYVKEIWNKKIKIIDLSGDFRLKDARDYESHYKAAHVAPELLQESVYGMTELNSEQIKKAVLVANPGCYPTSIILPLSPLLKEKMINPGSISINSHSGVSGTGRTPLPGRNMFQDAFNNVIPYKINQHQHMPEIEQQLSAVCSLPVSINFVPNVTSIENGIISAIFTTLNNNTDLKQIEDVYHEYYKDSCFIKYYRDSIPVIKDVVDTNNCLIHAVINKKTKTLILLSLIDNRIKGGSGQAVQNMNLMLGLPDTAGFLY